MTSQDKSPLVGSERSEFALQRSVWKWFLGAVVIALLFLMWQCGSALRDRNLADAAVLHFHGQLNSGQYEDIYREADRDLSQEAKHDELVRLLQAVHTKLGNVGTEKLLSITVNTTTNGGTFTVTQYQTAFARGSAIETFTWRKHNGALKLYGYNIQSNDLFEEKSTVEGNSGREAEM